ncbi:tetratricopeptide repeat protein 9C [Esox lucius]|uniref:Tetratricopeptide repeat protein 9C n=1 Tax=Esox lucius TaxID=8010 RepID=C1BXA9_ESOLU|nr:tetratricopeptide repeat protein 9C [Esox lucius]ACO13662.1 Tetratricopeptide repeat protein 9C [Esox lucius]
MASPGIPRDESLELGPGAAVASFSGSSAKAGVKVDVQLQDAARLKTEGNKFYKEKNIRSAIGRYHRSLLILRSLDSDITAAVKGFGPEAPVLNAGQEDLLRNIQVDCYNNLAACLLQREHTDYTRVLEYSLRVLRWRPGDVKALYRAGVAPLELGDAQGAKQYLTQATKGQPNDANVRRHLQRVEERLSTEYQKEKALYQGMFSSSQRNGSGEGASVGVTQK